MIGAAGDQISQISQVGIAHVEVISALHGACFETPWDSKAIGETLAMPGSVALLGGAENLPQGFILFRLAADEAEIISIGVLNKARRTGLAGKLLQGAIVHAQAQGCDKMFLEVAQNNKAARGLYENSDFVICGRRPAYYDSEVGKGDALIYRLEINTK